MMKDSKRKPNGYWTKEKCRKEALKYNTRYEFFIESRGAYKSSRRKGWLDEVCKHMIEILKPKGYWTKEKCRKEALKYKKRTKFQRGSSGAYDAVLRNGWLDDVCKHMEVGGSRHKRCIYSFEFEDNYVYVGLTYNIKMRYEAHMNDINSSVYKHIEETKLTPKFIQLTDYMDAESASKEETVWENKYISEGWDMLNIKKTGGLGGDILKWDYDSCKKEALKYKIRSEFKKESPSAYGSSLRHRWLDDICKHMVEIMKPKGYWTKENCRKEALKYKTRHEFQKGSDGAYKKSWRNGWLDDVCKHMIKTSKLKGHWNIKENCRREVLKYKTRSELIRKSVGAYQSIRRNGWEDELCSHMGDKRKPPGYWDYDSCKKEALKYNTRNEFQKGSNGALMSSWRNGWLDEFFPKTKKV